MTAICTTCSPTQEQPPSGTGQLRSAPTRPRSPHLPLTLHSTPAAAGPLWSAWGAVSSSRLPPTTHTRPPQDKANTPLSRTPAPAVPPPPGGGHCSLGSWFGGHSLPLHCSLWLPIEGAWEGSPGLKRGPSPISF